MDHLNASDIIEKLQLAPHPEGGHFRETFRDEQLKDGRSVGTAIYFMLQAGEISRWHKVDASEIWHFHAGAPLELGLADPEENSQRLLLGTDLSRDQLPQRIVPAGWWQQARSLGDWTLVSCTVSPGFEFSAFEMAPPGWEPKA